MLAECVRCGGEYKPNLRTSKYCSLRCSNSANAGKRAKYKRCSVCRHAKPSVAFNRNNRLNRKESTAVCTSCARLERKRKAALRPWYHERVRRLIKTCRHRAKLSNTPFSITRDDIVIPEFCPVLGIRFEDVCRGPNVGVARHGLSPSIDRIDSSKGYTPDNVVVVSTRVNSLKSDATIGELIAMAKFYSKLAAARGIPTTVTRRIDDAAT